MQNRGSLDALFVHTHVPAVLATSWLRRVPTVLSVDASPLQYDMLGEHYDHRTGNRYLEQMKWRATKRCFEEAQHIVTWSSWAKSGVVHDYGIDGGKVTIIPPGVPASSWNGSASHDRRDGTFRLLFVGGDFRRKGGDLLIEAYEALRQELGVATMRGTWSSTSSRRRTYPLRLASSSTVISNPTALSSSSSTSEADVFCLPTRGDCLPMVLSEAGAAGLPLVATAVAGVPEIVRDGETGLDRPSR